MHFCAKFVSVFLSSVLFLSACDEQGNPIQPAASSNSGASGSAAPAAASASVTRGKTAQERSLESRISSLSRDTRDIIVRNTVQGALAGAAAGCLVARMAGRECVQGAVAGGVLGGIAGNQVGQQAADVNARLVKADETIARLTQVNQELNGIETDLRAVLRAQNSEIASLRRQVDAGQVSARAANSRIQAINSNRQTIARGLETTEQNIANERTELVSLEQESGQSFRTERRAIDSSQSRVRNLRNTVAIAAS